MSRSIVAYLVITLMAAPVCAQAKPVFDPTEIGCVKIRDASGQPTEEKICATLAEWRQFIEKKQIAERKQIVDIYNPRVEPIIQPRNYIRRF